MRFLPEGPSFCAGRQGGRKPGSQGNRQQARRQAGRCRHAGMQACRQAGRQTEQPWSPEDVPSRLLPVQHVTSLFIVHTLL